MAKLQSVLAIYLPNAKEFLTVYSLIVSEDEIDRRNLANFYDGVRIASSIGLKDQYLLGIVQMLKYFLPIYL